MATVTKPMALDRSMNTTEQSPRNVADVLAQELSGIATAISGGSDKVPKTDVATVEPTNVASRAYNKDELVYVNGNLYKVITAISGGATFTVGTNIQSTNVSNGLKQDASEVSYDDTTSAIRANNVQNAIEKLARGKKPPISTITVPCGAGYGAYLFTVFTHGVGSDIIKIHVSAGAVNLQSLITGTSPSGISSATYGADLLTITFANVTAVSYIGADPNGGF